MSKHQIPPTPPIRIWDNLNTLTIPNYQPYLKFKLNKNTMVIYAYVPFKTTTTPTDITIDRRKNFSPNTNGPSPPNNTRPMPHTNGLAHHHKNHINWTNDEHLHKTNSANDPKMDPIKSPKNTHTTYEKMSNNDDRTTNNDTTGHRGQQKGRVPRGRTRGSGFDFNLNA